MSTLHLHMLQQTRSKNENEENEDQDQPEDALLHQDLMSTSSKLASKEPAMKNARYGKIVKVNGGHIVRSMSKKDRHSKVYTCKGPRDRRFRLSAQTAIQFYDVQDRLGYDRPSKAIDWLIQKAEAAIEALSQEDKAKVCDWTDADCSVQKTEQDIGEQCINQLQNLQGSNVELEAVNNMDSLNNGNCFSEEALNSAFDFSDSKVTEMAQMGWFQSLMAWNYNAGDAIGGEGRM